MKYAPDLAEYKDKTELAKLCIVDRWEMNFRRVNGTSRHISWGTFCAFYDFYASQRGMGKHTVVRLWDGMDDLLRNLSAVF